MRSSALAGFTAGIAITGASALALTQLGHGHSTSPTLPATTRSISNTAADPASRVYSGAKNSVAYITAQADQGTATGSGFVVSSDGKVVTNEHVVDGAQQVTVKLGTGGQEQDATVLAADASKDLALLAIDTGGEGVPPLPAAGPSQGPAGGPKE